ncbi:MAG: hypothetical protein LAT81_04620 [Oceanicaulis sp.]|nr:hypothetical protein [Oceanicaulis sp.]
MTDIYNIDRFTITGALSRFVRTVAARPAEAARLIAMDAAVIGLFTGFACFAWPAFMATKPAGWQQGPLAACAIIGALLALLMWEAAWQRFLAGKPTRAGLPWRLGEEEGLMLGALVVAWLLISIVGICGMIVVMPFGLLLSEGLGASPAVMTLAGAPVFLILFVIIYRFMCGVALTMVRGQMSVFHGFGGVRRHLWGFAAAMLFLGAVNWIVFELFNGVANAPARFDNVIAGRSGGSMLSVAAIAAYLALSALSAHLFRGIYMESALVTANLGPVPERGSGPDPVSTLAH